MVLSDLLLSIESVQIVHAQISILSILVPPDSNFFVHWFLYTFKPSNVG